MDFAPGFFSICAFVVGVMWIDTIASEVREWIEDLSRLQAFTRDHQKGV